MKKFILFIAFILIVTMVLGVGCKEEATEAEAAEETTETTAAEETTETTAAEETTENNEPKNGGTLIVSLSSEPTHLDEQLYAEFAIVWVTDPINECLFRWNDDGTELEPRLATSWEIVNDKTIKFELREGVKFHNGRIVVATDVKNSIERILTNEEAASARSNIESVESVEVLNDYEFLIHLKKPDAAILGGLGRVPIIPIEEAENMKTNPVGCGPFKFESWDKGSKITFVRNPDYWDQPKPYLDKLIWVIQPEYASEVASLQAGDVDLIPWLGTEDIINWKSQPPEGIKIDQGGGSIMSYHYLGFNMAIEPWKSNLNLRKAILYGVDWKEVCDLNYHGTSPYKLSWIGESSPYYNPEWQIPYDLEKAKDLMIEAGYPDGLTAGFYNVNSPIEKDLGEIFKDQFAKFGITLEPETLDVPIYVDLVFNKHDFELNESGGESFNDPAILADIKLKTEGGWNWGEFSNTEIDQWLTEARETFDFDTRYALYDKVMKWMIENAAPIICWGDASAKYAAMSEKVMGWTPCDSDTRYSFEEIWLNE